MVDVGRKPMTAEEAVRQAEEEAVALVKPDNFFGYIVQECVQQASRVSGYRKYSSTRRAACWRLAKTSMIVHLINSIGHVRCLRHDGGDAA